MGYIIQPCLTCMICRKRLDALSLVEHDGEVCGGYCKRVQGSLHQGESFVALLVSSVRSLTISEVSSICSSHTARTVT